MNLNFVFILLRVLELIKFVFDYSTSTSMAPKLKKKIDSLETNCLSS